MILGGTSPDSFIKGIKQDKLGKANRATEPPLSGQVWDTMARGVVAY